MEKRILVTGFEPFGFDVTNVSQQVLELFPDRLSQWQIAKCCLPVSFRRASQDLRRIIADYQPEYVFLLGQCGPGQMIRLECFAKNRMNANGPDNDFYTPKNVVINPDAPTILQTEISLKELCEKEDSLLPRVISYHAGLYVCNRVYFESLEMNDHSLFIHLPKNQNPEKCFVTVLDVIKKVVADGTDSGTLT